MTNYLPRSFTSPNDSMIIYLDTRKLDKIKVIKGS